MEGLKGMSFLAILVWKNDKYLSISPKFLYFVYIKSVQPLVVYFKNLKTHILRIVYANEINDQLA